MRAPALLLLWLVCGRMLAEAYLHRQRPCERPSRLRTATSAQLHSLFSEVSNRLASLAEPSLAVPTVPALSLSSVLTLSAASVATLLSEPPPVLVVKLILAAVVLFALISFARLGLT